MRTNEPDFFKAAIIFSPSKYVKWVLHTLEKYNEIDSVLDLCKKISKNEGIPEYKIYYSEVYRSLRFLEQQGFVKCVKEKNKKRVLLNEKKGLH